LGVDPEDLSADYEDFASSIEGLGYLESGITKPLNQVAGSMLEFAKLQRQSVSIDLIPLASHFLGVPSSRIQETKSPKLSNLSFYLFSPSQLDQQTQCYLTQLP